jgi:hypothetical protein
VISSTRNPVYAKQKLPPSRPRGPLFLCLLLVAMLLAPISALCADALEEAARSLARKVDAVAQREPRLFLSWQNHSSLSVENSEALRKSFAQELDGEKLVEKQEAGVAVLRVFIEETPALYLLIANVPGAKGQVTRIASLARGGLTSDASSGTTLRLEKELIWHQQEPILDAVEMGEDSSKPGPLLILNRDNLSLYRRENDRWELQDSKRLPTLERVTRAPRGEIRLSPDNGKQDNIVLPGQTCDVTITERVLLNCRAATPTWGQGMLLTSPCDRGVWLLGPGSGDWSAPERLLLRQASFAKSSPSAAELELPGPARSISAGRHPQSGTATIFNLSTGNYEVYRITLACGN